jgi:sulfur-carrier protein
MSAMQISVRYFASLREALGSGEAVQCRAGTTLEELRDQLIARGGAHSIWLARGRAVRCALNQEMVAGDANLHDGAEVAYFPPVTGG